MKLSTYSYLLLHRMLEIFCYFYNDIIEMEDNPEECGIIYRNRIIRNLDISDFSDVYFHDTDFDFDPEIYNTIDQSLKEKLRFTNETYGVVNRMMPHPDELLPWVVDIELNNEK